MGCRYSLTHADVLQAERKVRLRHILNTFPCDDQIFKLADAKKTYASTVDTTPYLDCVNNVDNFEVDENVDNVLVYVAGVGQRIVDKCTNENCSFKNSELEPHIDYINDVNRGGLVVPCKEIADLLRYMAALLASIIATKSLDFQREARQVPLLVDMSLWSLSDKHGTNLCKCAWSVARMFARTLLKNMMSDQGQRLELKLMKQKFDKKEKAEARKTKKGQTEAGQKSENERRLKKLSGK